MKSMATAKPARRKIKDAAPLELRPQSPPTAILTLPQKADMRAARALKLSLEPLLQSRRACVLDASEISMISTGCLQIIVAFAAAMRAAATPMTINRPSTAFQQSVALMGLAPALSTFTMET